MSAALTFKTSAPVRAWSRAAIIMLAPIWLLGILNRGLWTPDEPREADISWRMSQQEDRTLPRLADTPFLEKPPLSYWMSAAAIDTFGDYPGAARLPNIVYAIVTTVAVGTIAYYVSGAAAAFLSAIFAASALILFRVEVWLAPDAGLLAGCALSLLGLYLGFTAPPGRRKLLGYGLMHLGAALGFMMKSAPGWLAPGLALLTLIVWERRWAELRRWELYAGLLLQAAIIGPWILAVSQTSQGTQALLAFFWHNVVGRFTRIEAPAGLDYTSGHPNWPGKYLLELPVYLFPWTLLAVAAVARAWRRVRTPGLEGTGWRFSIAASVPFLLVLSFSATARDIYSAPALLGLCLLMGLWAAEVEQAPGKLDNLALRGTQVLVGFITCVFVGFLIILGLGRSENVESIGSVSGVVLLAAAVIVPAIATVAIWNSVSAQRRGEVHQSLVWSYAGYAGALCLSALAAFPAVDRWQDLGLLASDIHRDSHGTALALLDPDETTIAMLDHQLKTPFDILVTSEHDDARRVVANWFLMHDEQARVLVALPGHAPGEFNRFMARIRPSAPPGDGIAGKLATQGVATPVRRYQLPQGRRYEMLGPP
ncbi:MAG TPA: glycosyltransferase family 39 protein [Steroidobacteraceae bacterium]|jgi:4-amino-4-deoxy-L-arabinose transferase-like glycosyltransferase